MPLLAAITFGTGATLKFVGWGMTCVGVPAGPAVMGAGYAVMTASGALLAAGK